MPCAKSSMELVCKNGRLSSIPFLKSSIPFHSGIFHIPYQNFPSIPYRAQRVSYLRDLRKKKGKMSILAAKSSPCKCSLRLILTVLPRYKVVYKYCVIITVEPNVLLLLGSDYFTKNFQVKENKTKEKYSFALF